MSDPGVDIRQMLAELEFPISANEEPDLLCAFGDALQPLYRLLVDARTARRTSPQANRPLRSFHPLAGGLSDPLGRRSSKCLFPPSRRLHHALDLLEVVDSGDDQEVCRIAVSIQNAPP